MAINPFTTEAQVTQMVQDMGTKMTAIIQNHRGVSAASYRPKEKYPIVSFITDDGHISTKNWLTPIFRDRGLRCTIAVIGKNLTNPSYMSIEDVLSHYHEGFDIANHTYYHEQGFNYEEYDENVAKGRLVLNQYGIECPMFVSPWGEGGWRLEIVKKYHEANFRTRFTLENPPPLTTYSINRESIDTKTLADHKAAVDYIEANGGWLVFVIHPQYSEYANNPTRKQDIADTIDYIIGKDIPILTARMGFEFYKNYVEIGSRGIDGSYYLMGMDGSEDGDFLNTVQS